MLAELEDKKAKLRQESLSFKDRRSQLNAEASKWAAKRNELNKATKELIEKAQELKKLRVSAVIQLDGQTITGYSMGSSGDAACDAAARAKLDAAKGSQVPPPPEDHPEFLQPSYSVTFACAN